MYSIAMSFGNAGALLHSELATAGWSLARLPSNVIAWLLSHK
jgi:hypothetical protein